MEPSTAVIAVDEFALLSNTTAHYAWAARNTAPKIPSNEQRRTRLNGFLAVNLHTGATTVDFQAEAKTANAVEVLARLALRLAQRGIREIRWILDNCRIHGAAMKTALLELLAEIPLAAGLTVRFLHTPVYSPDYNPAEYVIHRVRQQSLYHLPVTFTLNDRAQRIQSHLAQAPLFSSGGIANILGHIDRLPKSGWS